MKTRDYYVLIQGENRTELKNVPEKYIDIIEGCTSSPKKWYLGEKFPYTFEKENILKSYDIPTAYGIYSDSKRSEESINPYYLELYDLAMNGLRIHELEEYMIKGYKKTRFSENFFVVDMFKDMFNSAESFEDKILCIACVIAGILCSGLLLLMSVLGLFTNLYQDSKEKKCGKSYAESSYKIIVKSRKHFCIKLDNWKNSSEYMKYKSIKDDRSVDSDFWVRYNY
jgi:hypothetical protein